MLSLEFILVLSLLLGCAALLMQPIEEQEKEWEKRHAEWEKEYKTMKCDAQKKLSETRFVLWKNECGGNETIEGWEAHHYA